jgi:hypothetical protein
MVRCVDTRHAARRNTLEGEVVAQHKAIQKYALEMTGIFVAGLGMMLLIVISVWVASLVAVGSSLLGEEAIGELPTHSEQSERFSYLRGLEVDAGQVAGVVDETSIEEKEIRNAATQWLSEVREIQSLPIAYRDSVLDRNAQNHARFLATSCPDERYNDWDQLIETRVDEGYTNSFSEAVFVVSGSTFAEELPASAIDYSRLFTVYDAVGVGVAELTDDSKCGQGYFMVFHVADVR